MYFTVNMCSSTRLISSDLLPDSLCHSGSDKPLAQAFSMTKGLLQGQAPHRTLLPSSWYQLLSCTGLLSPNGDNKAYLFITIYTMSLENVEFFVLIIFNTYKMIF